MKTNFIDRLAKAIAGRLPNQKDVGPEFTTRKLIDQSGGIQSGVCDADELQALSDLHDRHNKAVAVIRDFTPATAKSAWAEHQKKGFKALTDGTPDDHEFWSIADWTEDYDERSQAAKAAMRDIYRESLPICQPIAARFAEMANKKAAEMEEAERQLYERFCVAYPGPSPLVHEFRKCATLAAARVVENEYGTYGPSDLCPYLADYL